MALLQVHVEGDDQVHRATLEGSLDARSAAAFERAMEPTLTHRALCIVVDLDGVDALSSAGAGALLVLSGRAARVGSCVAVSRPRPAVRYVLELLRVSDVIPMIDVAPATPHVRPLRVARPAAA
jgi:anti-anti-sigma factor